MLEKIKEKTSEVGGVIKEKVVENAAKIDYSVVMDFLSKRGSNYPETICLLNTLNEASEVYQETNSPTKESDFIRHIIESIDVPAALEEIKPLASQIPYGTIIVTLLKFISKKNEDKKGFRRTPIVKYCPECEARRKRGSSECHYCGYDFTSDDKDDIMMELVNFIDEGHKIYEPENKYSKIMFLPWILLYPLMLCFYLMQKKTVKKEMTEGKLAEKVNAMVNFPLSDNPDDILDLGSYIYFQSAKISKFEMLGANGMRKNLWNRVLNEKASQILAHADSEFSEDEITQYKINKNHTKIFDKLKKGSKNPISLLISFGILFLAIIAVVL